MADTAATQASRRVITPEAILSYPAVFEPRKPNKQGEDPKYQGTFVFLEGTDLKPMKLIALEVLKEKFGENAPALVKKGKLHWPFREDEWEEKGYPEGSVFVNASSKQRPGVVSIYPDPNNGGKPTPITDPDEIYPGCIVKASLTCFPFDREGKKGVSWALNNIQKIRDGDRLDSRKKAEDEFSADPNAVADLGDLENGGEVNEDADEVPAPKKAAKPAAKKAKPADDEDDLSDLIG